MSESVLTGNEQFVSEAAEFFVRDLETSMRFYVGGLGFKATCQEPTFAVVALGEAHLMLVVAGDENSSVQQWLSTGPRGVGVNIRIMVEDVDAMYQLATKSGAIVNDIDDRTYGLRDFMVADPDGFMLRFASPIRK